MLCQVEDGIEIQVVENSLHPMWRLTDRREILIKNRPRQRKLLLTEPEKMELEIRVFAIWIAEKRSLVAQFI